MRKRIIEFEKKDYFSFPNILCYFRILLVPVFLVTYIIGGLSNDIFLKYFGLGSIIVASLTDFVDGKIARHFNQITELGKFLDPLADKLMQFAICVAVGVVYEAILGTSFTWVLIAIFLAKELTQLFVAYHLYRKGKWLDGAKWYGKVATFGFDVVMIMLLICTFIPTIPLQVLQYSYYISVSIAILLLTIAFILYIIDFYHLSKVEDNETLNKYKKGKDKQND